MKKLTRIGIFYDGYYFSIVSTYYAYHHEKKSRISLSGLHQFVKTRIARAEDLDPKYVSLVEAHYFRGRHSTQQAAGKDKDFYKERVWEDVLIKENVTTHYLPMQARFDTNGYSEKGIDVWLALECFELAQLRDLDVVVLVCGDSDYLPLVRKLHRIGVRVAVLGWNIPRQGESGEGETRVSHLLMREATYPFDMTSAIESMGTLDQADLAAMKALFIRSRNADHEEKGGEEASDDPRMDDQEDGWQDGTICHVQDGYGFIAPAAGGENLFFYHTSLEQGEFADLFKGREVRFKMGIGARGTQVATEVRTTLMRNPGVV